MKGNPTAYLERILQQTKWNQARSNFLNWNYMRKYYVNGVVSTSDDVWRRMWQRRCSRINNKLESDEMASSG